VTNTPTATAIYTPTPTPTPTPQPGIIGLWHLDEDGGDVVHDSSPGSGNDGIIYGGEWVDGRVGSGLRFDGTDDYITMSSNVDLGSSYSIELWVKLDSTASTDQNFIDNDDCGRLSAAGNTKVYFVDVGPGIFLKTASGTLTTGIWYHIVGTYDGAAAKVYVNGELSATRTGLSGSSCTPGGSLDIGRHNNGIRYTDGTIDEAAIYNRALTAEEILERYNSILPPSPTSTPTVTMTPTRTPTPIP